MGQRGHAAGPPIQGQVELAGASPMAMALGGRVPVRQREDMHTGVDARYCNYMLLRFSCDTLAVCVHGCASLHLMIFSLSSA